MPVMLNLAKDTVKELIRALDTGLGLCSEMVCGVL